MTNMEIMRTISTWCVENHEYDAYTRQRQCAKQLAHERTDVLLENLRLQNNPCVAMLLFERPVSRYHWISCFSSKYADILSGIRWKGIVPYSSGVLRLEIYGSIENRRRTFTLEIREPIDLDFPNMICFMHPLNPERDFRLCNEEEFIGLEFKYYFVKDRLDFATDYCTHRDNWSAVMRQLGESKWSAKITALARS